jgi:hypothetical protein
LLFGHYQDLLNSHETIRAGLEACVDNHYDEVGEAFAMVMDEIRKPYVVLARNHSTAVNVAMEFANHPQMQSFLSQTQSPVQPPILHIVAWQTRPVQHLDQLSTSLSSLVSATPEWHPAHFSTSSALNLVANLLSSTRRIMKKEEDLTRLRALTPLIQGWDGPGLEEWGDYIMHSPVTVTSSVPPPVNAPQEYLAWFNDPGRQLYLLTKVLIVLRNPVRGSRMMQLVDRIPCVRGVLEVRPDEVDGKRFFVDYLGPDMQSKRAMTVSVSTPEKRNEWLTSVNKILQANVRLTLPVIPKELQNQLVGPARTTTVSDQLAPPQIQQTSTSPKAEKKGLERLNTLARKLGLAKTFKTVSTDMTRPVSVSSPLEKAPPIQSIETEVPVAPQIVDRRSSLIVSQISQLTPTQEDVNFPPRMSSMRSSVVSASPTKQEWHLNSPSKHDSMVPESPLSPNFDELIDDLYSYPAWAASSIEQFGPGDVPVERFEADGIVESLLKRHYVLSVELTKLKDEAVLFSSPLLV